MHSLPTLTLHCLPLEGDIPDKTLFLPTHAAGRLEFTVTITGRPAPYALTPHKNRADPLLCAARLLDLADRMAARLGPTARALLSSPEIAAAPGQMATTATLKIGFDHAVAAELAKLAAQFPREAGFVARDSQTTLTTTKTLDLPPIANPPAILTKLQSALPAGISLDQTIYLTLPPVASPAPTLFFAARADFAPAALQILAEIFGA